MAESHPTRTAPFYHVPSRRIVSVEHPAIIRNVDKAIDTLQGAAGISKILNPPKADTPANLLLRPEDVMSRPVQSISSPSNNILLKVTVPKRTGRRRKRGSDEPFSQAPPELSDSTNGPPRPRARDLLQSLRDNVGKYEVEPVGIVDRTHVFRGMPDFVFSTTSSKFINRFREQIMPFDYEKMKQFDLDMSKGATLDADLIPPPSFSHGDVPFNYFYRQNPTVRQSIDTSGNITTVNTQQATKVLTHLVPYDIATVPSKPRDSCPPISTLDPILQETIKAVQALFDSRPAWTRRGLRNSLKTLEQRYALRHAVPYTGYIFRSGPWRDAIVRFGYDPRTDPSSHIYQTTMFRILPREAELARDGGAGRRHAIPRPNEPNALDPSSSSPTTATTTLQSTSHLFTGQPPLPRDGRMWMFCDITDPLLCSILFPGLTRPPNFLRETCDIMCDGWYGSGALAKAKAIMRSKIQTLFEDRVPDDTEFDKVITFPNHIPADGNMSEFWLDPSAASTRDLQLATEIRATMKGAATWRGRIPAPGMMGLGKGSQDERREGEEQRQQKSVRKTETEGGKASSTRQTRFVDDDGDDEEDEDGVVAPEGQSEGEEEEIEQEEIAEAVAAAIARRGGGGEDEELEEENESDIE